MKLHNLELISYTHNILCTFADAAAGLWFISCVCAANNYVAGIKKGKFNPFMPRVQKIIIHKLALADFYWLNL